MLKIAKSAVLQGRETPFEGKGLTFEGYPLHYPLRKVLSCDYEGALNRYEGKIYLSMRLSATLEVEDTSDATLFEYPLSFEERDIEIMETEDGEGEGYIFPGNTLDIDEVALTLIQSHLPIRLVHKKD